MSIEPNRFEALRCADEDREVVAQLLNNAYAEGRLTFDEHADRIARAYDSKTFGELDVLTTDLVAPDPRRQQQQAVSLTTNPPSYVAAPGDFTGGNAVLSTFKHHQSGVVAPEVTLNAWLGEVRVDLVGATFMNRTTRITVGGMMGEIKIRVPEGVDVKTSSVTPVMGEVKVEGLVPHPDGIVLDLSGVLVMGEVKVLGPNSNPKKYEKFVK